MEKDGQTLGDSAAWISAFDGTFFVHDACLMRSRNRTLRSLRVFDNIKIPRSASAAGLASSDDRQGYSF